MSFWCSELMKFTLVGQHMMHHRKNTFNASQTNNANDEIAKHIANSLPLVFDVPIVPSKVKGIFEKSNGSLNFTALRNLVRELNFKSN